MSEQTNLTPWFDEGTLPTRPGAYEVESPHCAVGARRWSWFDGRHFRGCWHSPKEAWDMRGYEGRWSGQVHYGAPPSRWRGLAAAARQMDDETINRLMHTAGVTPQFVSNFAGMTAFAELCFAAGAEGAKA